MAPPALQLILTSFLVLFPGSTSECHAFVRSAKFLSGTYYIYGIGLAYEVIFNTSTTGAFTTETAPRYYHYDNPGSTIALADFAHPITDRVEYDIHGRTLHRFGTTNTLFLALTPELLKTGPTAMGNIGVGVLSGVSNGTTYFRNNNK
jgi:hypothetical protein